MDTIKARNPRNLKLTERQVEIVCGSLLGDGYLVKTTRGHAFRVNHSVAQKSYVDWKYRELEMLVNSSPRSSNNCYYFRTVTHDHFSEMRDQFYNGKNKILPENFEKMLSPLVLAVWIMDDGAKDWNQLRINTQSFSKFENEEMASIIKAKLGINVTLNRDKDRFRLRVSAESMSIIRQLVQPHIITSMQYKLFPVTTSDDRLCNENLRLDDVLSGNTSPS